MIKEFIEIGGVLLIPIIVFFVAVSIYPLDNQETNFLLSVHALNNNLTISNVSQSYPTYILSIASVSNLRGGFRGEAFVKNVEIEEVNGVKVLILESEYDNKTVYIALVNPANISEESVKIIKNRLVAAEGVLIKKDGKSIILAKLIVLSEKKDSHVREGFIQCIYKKKCEELCKEIIRKRSGKD